MWRAKLSIDVTLSLISDFFATLLVVFLSGSTNLPFKVPSSQQFQRRDRLKNHAQQNLADRYLYCQNF
jgi:hypothetical protein